MRVNVFLGVTYAVFFWGFMHMNLWLLCIICPNAINSPLLLVLVILLLSLVDVFVWSAIGKKIGVLRFRKD